MNATRLSPLHDSLRAAAPGVGRVERAWRRRCVSAAASGLRIELADLSALRRAGLKGPGAADCCTLTAVPVPSRPNAWSPLDGDGLVARLGRSEFLVEDGPRGDFALTVQAELGAGVSGVYPVLRQDAALLVRGDAVRELFVADLQHRFQRHSAARADGDPDHDGRRGRNDHQRFPGRWFSDLV